MNSLSSRPHLLGLVAGLFLAAGLVFSAMLVTRAWLQIAESQNITVTGATRKTVRSDLAIWRGFFAAEGNTLLGAQQSLKADLEKVERFLRSKQFTNFITSSISIQELRAKTRKDGEVIEEKIAGFRLTQSVEIQSSDVDGVTQLSRDTTTLIEQGVVFTTSAPEYIYTKAGEAKVEMLAEATKDARTRAEQIVSQGGRRIHQLRSARMGIFQITPLHSTQTSGEGLNDTTSLEKTITSIVSATFSMQ